MAKRKSTPKDSPDQSRAEVYPGVTVELGPRCATFEGDEGSLRRAGILQPDDRIPMGSRWGLGVSKLSDGSLRVRLKREEAAARDAAYRRFTTFVRDACIVVDVLSNLPHVQRDRALAELGRTLKLGPLTG